MILFKFELVVYLHRSLGNLLIFEQYLYILFQQLYAMQFYLNYNIYFINIVIQISFKLRYEILKKKTSIT